MDPRGTIGKEDHYASKPIADNATLRAWPVWAPGAQLAGFIKKSTIHCYTQNLKALSFVG